MILHFEIDQEVTSCIDCIFSYLDRSFGECWCKLGYGTLDGKITERLVKIVPSMTERSEEFNWSVINSIPEWCPCAKVEEEEDDC